MKKLENQWALITGASSGLGLEVAKRLSSQKCHLICTARNLDRLEELRPALTAGGNQLISLPIDLCQHGAEQKLYEACSSENKKIQILINNAGIGCSGDLLSFSPDRIEDMLKLNSIAPVQLTRLFIPHMKEHGLNSHILNIGSLAGFNASSNISAYGASKSLLWRFSVSLQRQLKNTPIHVSYAAPGAFNTSFLTKSGAKVSPAHLSKLMSVETVASSVLNGMMNNKHLIVPGVLNQLRYLVLRYTPDPILDLVMN